MFVTFNSMWDKVDMTMPSCLGFAQAYQLNLSPDMKRMACQFNVNYWMMTVRSGLEVATGPRFNHSYMTNGLADNYAPFLLSTKLSNQLKEFFVGEFDMEKLLKYHISVKLAFSKKDKVTMAHVNEAYEVLKLTTEFAECEQHRLAATEVDQDMMADGTKARVSNSVTFAADKLHAKITAGAPLTNPTQIIMPSPSQVDPDTMMKMIMAAARSMQPRSTTPPASALDVKKKQLAAKYPTYTDDMLQVIAKKELDDEASKGLVRRMLGGLY